MIVDGHVHNPTLVRRFVHQAKRLQQGFILERRVCWSTCQAWTMEPCLTPSQIRQAKGLGWCHKRRCLPQIHWLQRLQVLSLGLEHILASLPGLEHSQWLSCFFRYFLLTLHVPVNPLPGPLLKTAQARCGVGCGIWRGDGALFGICPLRFMEVRVRFGICTYKSRVNTFLNYTVLFCILVWYTMGCWDCWNPRIGMIPDSGPVGSPHFPRYPGWPSDEQVPWLRFWWKSFWKNLPFISRSVLADFMMYIYIYCILCICIWLYIIKVHVLYIC